MSKRELKKEYTTSSGTRKNTTSQIPSLTIYLESQTKYFRYRHIINYIKINEAMKISLFNGSNDWLHLTNNNFLAPISIEEIFVQTIFFNP